MKTLFVATGAFRKLAYDLINERKGNLCHKNRPNCVTKSTTRSSGGNYEVCDTSDQLYQQRVDQWGVQNYTTDFREGNEGAGSTRSFVATPYFQQLFLLLPFPQARMFSVKNRLRLSVRQAQKLHKIGKSFTRLRLRNVFRRPYAIHDT